MIRKLLIANRGEIAVRIIRTAKRLGIRTVAVYSEADARALFVRQADEAYLIGAAPARESYLCGDRILDLAQRIGVDAVHPGYGFLSENAHFARACEQAGIRFVGPPATAIEAMGSKSAAKARMADAGVPLVPGYHGDEQTDARFLAEAERIGYPVLLKASAGGGGKGMRVVDKANELIASLNAARNEARNAFGDDHFLAEKYLRQPRHVEVQLFFDQAGNGVYLFDRDCSVQRRHQKVVEEAPAPGLSDALRQRMGEAAVACGKAIGYVGAGTVEFLLDHDGQFYFMEMNTRLQVEHPVTEMITRQDLVEWQLRVAAGDALPLSQSQLAIHGHAIEARVYAEDPDTGFLPAIGRLAFVRLPVENDHLRIDSGVQQGDEITAYYDPMIAKVITWGPNRLAAIARLDAALANYAIGGVRTNIRFVRQILATEDFRAAKLSTHFIDDHHAVLFSKTALTATDHAIALAAWLSTKTHDDVSARSPWDDTNHWRLGGAEQHSVRLQLNGDEVALRYQPIGPKHYRVLDGDAALEVQVHRDGDRLAFLFPQQRLVTTVWSDGKQLTLFSSDQTMHVTAAPAHHTDNSAHGAHGLKAPMHGKIVAVPVSAGEYVNEGTVLVVMEAMKMEHAIRAPQAGVVNAVLCAVGQMIPSEQLLVDFTAEENA